MKKINSLGNTKNIKGDARSRVKDVKGKVLEFLKCQSAFFDENQYEALRTGTDSLSYDAIAGRACTEKKIGDGLGIKRTTIHEAVERLRDEGKVLIFRPDKRNKKLVTCEEDVNGGSLGKLISLPTRNQAYSGYELMSSLGGQIVASPKILKHFVVSHAMPDLELSNFRLHFAWGLKMIHVTINSSVWDDLGGRPLVLFLSNSFAPDDKKTRDAVFDVDQKILSPFGEGVAVLRLPVQGVRPPLRKFRSLNQSSTPPLLGTVALTLYPNNKQILLSRFTKEPISVCDLIKTENIETRSLNHLLSINRWTMAGTRWPEALPSEDGYQTPTLEDLVSPEQSEVNTFLSAKTSPGHIDCRRWFQFHMTINAGVAEAKSTAPRCDEDDTFREGIIHNSWLVSASSLIGLRQSYFVISN